MAEVFAGKTRTEEYIGKTWMMEKLGGQNFLLSLD
jgi:hypothetical protein